MATDNLMSKIVCSGNKRLVWCDAPYYRLSSQIMLMSVSMLILINALLAALQLVSYSLVIMPLYAVLENKPSPSSPLSLLYWVQWQIPPAQCTTNASCWAVSKTVGKKSSLRSRRYPKIKTPDRPEQQWSELGGPMSTRGIINSWELADPPLAGLLVENNEVNIW